jgi:biotin carboxylase
MKVLLLAHEPGIALQVLICLQAAGAQVHVLGGARARHLRLSRACAGFYRTTFTPDRELHAQARLIDVCARHIQADIVVPGDALTTHLLANVAAQLKTPTFPVPSRDLFQGLNDKWNFAQLLDGLDLPAPKTKLFRTKADLDFKSLARTFGTPFIVKPTNEGNSNGVVVVRDAQTFNDKIANNPHYPYQPLLAQEYVPGIDVDLSLLAIRGEVLASAVQRREDKAIVFFPHDEYTAIVKTLVAATGFSGVAHLDGRLDARDGKIKLIECNPRFWGSITASLVCGVNFVAEGIKLGLGAAQPASPLSVVSGLYLSPGGLIVEALRHPTHAAVRSPASAAALRQAVGDPLPHLAEYWDLLRRKGIAPRVKALRTKYAGATLPATT